MDDFTKIGLHGFWANTLVGVAKMFATQNAPAPTNVEGRIFLILRNYSEEIGKDASCFTKKDSGEFQRRVFSQIPYEALKQYYHGDFVSREEYNKVRNFQGTSNDTKECPYCAEIIKKKAIICRFCNREIVQPDNKKIQKKDVNNDQNERN